MDASGLGADAVYEEVQSMSCMDDFDWHSATREEQLRAVRAAKPAELNKVMRDYDWSLNPVTVLNHVSAQKGIGLSAALSAFFNGDPWRFNYLPKRDVSEEFRGVASLLDAICQRINAGFYLPDLVPLCAQDMTKLDAWVANQSRDLRQHLRGRWVIETEVLDPLFAGKRAAMEEALRREVGQAAVAAKSGKANGFKVKGLVGPQAG